MREQERSHYQDTSGFCKSATLEEIRKHGCVLTPGRYVGAEAQEDDGEPFEEKMTLEELLKEKREAILLICTKHGARNMLRIIDEDTSEPDGYLYPSAMFAPVELPEVARRVLTAAGD